MIVITRRAVVQHFHEFYLMHYLDGVTETSLSEGSK